MNETPEIIGIKRYLSEWEDVLARGDFRGGLFAALEGYKLSIATNDKLHEKIFLSFLKIAADELHNKLIPQISNGSNFKNNCSFCYKAISDSLYVLGTNVSICEECIKLAANAIATKA